MEFTETVFTPWSGLAGGALIGLSAGLLLFLNGKIAGISGIAAGLMTPALREIAWRGLFLAGLVLAAVLFSAFTDRPLPVDLQMGLPAMVLGGFLVGFGTRLGSGCTAGHGITGLARLSRRSLVATATFFVAAIVTTTLIRNWGAG